MANENSIPVFNYRALRLLVGIIALTIVPIVSMIAVDQLPSISASYYTEARDVFVGMLIIVGTFLWAYNGHTTREFVASKVASLAAICVAIFPTATPKFEWISTSTFNWSAEPIIHGTAAIILFIILAYFCFGPFREKTKRGSGKKKLRSKIYFTCGSVMVGCMFTGMIVGFTLTPAKMDDLGIIYWVEGIALVAFGIAWIVAGKSIGVCTDDEDMLHIRF